MKLFVASTALASLLSVCAGQGDYPPFEDAEGNFRTPDCVVEESDELPALAGGGGSNANFNARFNPAFGRRRRDADGELAEIKPYDPKDTPFVWYLNTEAKNGGDCDRFPGQTITEGGEYTDKDGIKVTLNQGPVLVPLGTYDVCVKFFAANRWFYTSGSNAPCSADNKCCEWFPPKQCNRRTRVPIWFEKPAAAASCLDAYTTGAAEPVLGVEYLQAKKVNDQTTVCVFKNAEKATAGEEDPEFQDVAANVVYCGGNCCIFN